MICGAYALVQSLISRTLKNRAGARLIVKLG